MKRIKGKLSFSNVIAMLALFVALGGSAYAATQLPKNSVGAKQLKKGAVTPAKLSVAAMQTITGPQGSKGAQGAQGAPGVPGTPGTPGAKGAAGATNVAVHIGPREVRSKVFCPAGQVATGGGGYTTAGEQLLWGSVPINAAGEFSEEGETPTGWFAGAENPTGVAEPVTSYVVCASP